MKIIRMLFGRPKPIVLHASDDDTPLPDPLREQFDQLRREIMQRKCAESGHPNRIRIDLFGAPPLHRCRDCGADLSDNP